MISSWHSRWCLLSQTSLFASFFPFPHPLCLSWSAKLWFTLEWVRRVTELDSEAWFSLLLVSISLLLVRLSADSWYFDRERENQTGELSVEDEANHVLWNLWVQAANTACHSSLQQLYLCQPSQDFWRLSCFKSFITFHSVLFWAVL